MQSQINQVLKSLRPTEKFHPNIKTSDPPINAIRIIESLEIDLTL